MNKIMIGAGVIRIWSFLVFATLMSCGIFAQDSTGRELPKPIKKSNAKSGEKAAKPATAKKSSGKSAKKSSTTRPTIRPSRQAAVPSKLIVTAPSGALIEIDGKERGFTGVDGKLIVTGITAGQHKVTAKAEGYDVWSGTLTMAASGTKFDVPMKKKPAPGQVMLSINEPGVEVIVDETHRITPSAVQTNQIEGLSEGKHRLRAIKPGFKEWRGSVTVKQGEAVPIKIELIPILDPEMVMVAEGVFMQGKNNGDKDQRPEHQVFVPAFEIARGEVTNRLYKYFIDATGHRPPQGVGYGWNANVYPAGQDDLPVVFVSWADAMSFCQWLSKETGHKYRLPTEAEWEKAMRAVEEKYSSAGSVWEWCSDWYDPDYYKVRDRINPQGPARGKKIKLMGFEGETKVLRGGGVGRGQILSRAAQRNYYFPEKSRFDIGFRIVREIERQPGK